MAQYRPGNLLNGRFRRMAATVADLQTKGIARLFNREQDRP